MNKLLRLVLITTVTVFTFSSTVIANELNLSDLGFQAEELKVDKETKRYFGEDFWFCQRWTDLGGKVYIYVMDYITHVGEHQYCGRFWDELLFTKKVDDGQKIK